MPINVMNCRQNVLFFPLCYCIMKKTSKGKAIAMQYISCNGSFKAEIRELNDLDDCRNVISCLRSAFGDSYIKQEMYSPENILSMQRNGIMHIYIAYAENGKAAGIIGWENVAMFPATAELCTLVVRPEYGSFGLGEALIRYAYDIAKQLDVVSVFSYPIASHLRAQRCIRKLEPVCCGFLPSVFSTEHFSNGVTHHRNPKDSLTVVAFNIAKKDTGKLYLKEKYHQLAEMTYNALNTDHTAVEICCLPTCDKTEYEYRYDSTHSTLYININAVGRDLGHFTEELVSHSSDPMFTAQLCLNICDEAAVYAADIIERAGFFFAGFHPLCKDREYCIYHFSGNVAFDIDDLDYVEEQQPFVDCIKNHFKEVQR